MSAEPRTIATKADLDALEAVPLDRQITATSVYALLAETAGTHAGRPAVTFQLRSGPKDAETTLTWAGFLDAVNRAANLFRAHGIGPGDTVAYLLPNTPETAVTLIAGMTAGIVAPINPLLEPAQIAAILRETKARALVTLKPFVKTDISARAAKAVRHAPDCKVVFEVGMAHHLDAPLRWLVGAMAPKREVAGAAKVIDFRKACAGQPGDRLLFDPPSDPDAVCGYFHTGGTTGAPKVAIHRHRGALYNGWLVRRLLLGPQDAVLCPLPLFHVLAAYPMLVACIAAGSRFIMPTPAGYRGDGVIANFWKLVERYRCTFFCTVPTAVAALMQRPVDADVSTLNYALCGSAPMPPELFRRFEAATGVKILEGYGQTETTCLISCNPPEGERKIGSVGYRMPYTEVTIVDFDSDEPKPCPTDAIGEICVRNAGCISGYLDPERDGGLFGPDGVLRTGDLGRLDSDGYLWITGRAKDIIIRSGHNIDPAVIEDALMAHEDVAFVGAVAQPDAYAGELPCAYVELREGADVSGEALRDFAARRVSDRAARPMHVEVLAELPKTAVGKVFKPDLRGRAIRRVYGAALEKAGIPATLAVIEDPRLGLVVEVTPGGATDHAALAAALEGFPRPWRLAGATADAHRAA